MTHVTHDPWVTGAVTPAQALHRFIDYPALYLDIVYVHTPLSCYIIAHESKLHTQAPVNLEFAKWKLKHCINITKTGNHIHSFISRATATNY